MTKTNRSVKYEILVRKLQNYDQSQQFGFSFHIIDSSTKHDKLPTKNIGKILKL